MNKEQRHTADKFKYAQAAHARMVLDDPHARCREAGVHRCAVEAARKKNIPATGEPPVQPNAANLPQGSEPVPVFDGAKAGSSV